MSLSPPGNQPALTALRAMNCETSGVIGAPRASWIWVLTLMRTVSPLAKGLAGVKVTSVLREAN